MPGSIPLAAATALVCLSLTGCGLGGPGSGPNRHFDPEGFGITFDYPYTLTEKSLRNDDSRADSDAVLRELALTDDDFITVRQDPVDPGSAASGMTALRPEIDQLVQVLDTHVDQGTPTTVGGMPGVEYNDDGIDVEQRFLYLLDGHELYLVHCRSTGPHRAEIDAAWDTVRQTLHSV